MADRRVLAPREVRPAVLYPGHLFQSEVQNGCHCQRSETMLRSVFFLWQTLVRLILETQISTAFFRWR